MFVIETSEVQHREIDEFFSPTQPLADEREEQDRDVRHMRGWHRSFAEVLRFSVVGGLNTLVDLLILNCLLWLFPTTSALMLLAYNSLAYSLGAVNSFLLNKYWTFGYRQRTTRRELLRFILTTLCGIGWSNCIIWVASNVLHPFLVNPTVWANVSKVFAIGGTALISYLGMRLWVFVSKGQQGQTLHHISVASLEKVVDERRALPATYEEDAVGECERGETNELEERAASKHSLSVVLTAYNEEQIIAGTVSDILNVLSEWKLDFEVLVVNDGSTDQTGEIVSALAKAHPQVRLITHPTNQGYGAALVGGFAAATKELTFFMDSDGAVRHSRPQEAGLMAGGMSLEVSHMFPIKSQSLCSTLAYVRKRNLRTTMKSFSITRRTLVWLTH